ncbi:MAG: response regulator [Candidatus Electrothrix sp. GM3_4]|nr:response regulator [Candidatus Electrothrix sp. GM3_4]
MRCNLGAKLIISHLGMGILPLLFISAMLWITASDSLEMIGDKGAAAVEKAALDQLETICRIKKEQTISFFEVLEGQLNIVRSAPWVEPFFNSLNQTFTEEDNSVNSRSWHWLVKKHDALIMDLCARLNWRDMFLINSSGYIIYSMGKGTDLGMSLSEEPLKYSSFGRAFAELQNNTSGKTVFGDFAPYPPLHNAPAAFLLIRLSELEDAYMAVQIDTDAIKKIMASASDKASTLEAYLVGPDGYMRSDSILKPEKYSVMASFGQGNKVNTRASQNALQGDTGVGITKDYLDNKVLSSWTPVDIFDTRWALTCEVDEVIAMKAKTEMTALRMDAEKQVKKWTVAGVLLTLLIVGAIAWVIVRSISRPIVQAARIADSIAGGDFERRLDMRRSDEIGQMADALDRMVEKVAKNFHDKTAMAELSDQMRGEQDMQILAQNIITYLAKFLKAQMASLYLVDRSGQAMTLKGGYAFHKSKGLNSRIKIGEGIAEQAALGKSMISVTDLPGDYVHINSSMGESASCNILAAPFIHEEEVLGVLEFASCSEFSGEQKDFLDSVTGNIAVAFHSARNRQGVQELLEETREQAEELKQSNDELIAAKKKIEERSKDFALASKYKSEFLANMSHELRTPLNSLLLLAQSLRDNRDGNLTEKQRKAARIIVESGKDLLGLINEILDLSKIEAGQVVKDVEEVLLSDLVENAETWFSHMAENKGLAFSILLADDAPQSIFTDRKRVEQILKNFLGNSMKFTSEGRIDLIFSRMAATAPVRPEILQSEQAITISVKDTGIGIPTDKQRSIFEAFQQADGSTARKYGGTGLGLSISKELAVLLGGEIGLVSELGKGSTFTLYLPVGTQAEQSSALQNESVQVHESSEKQQIIVDLYNRDKMFQGKKVLLVDDDMRNAFALSGVLEQKGMEVIIAEDGKRALEILVQEEGFDIVLMDIMMPEMDGYEATRKIREQAQFRKLPIIALTANAMKDDRDKCLEAGANDYLTKPVDVERLLSMMRVWLYR